MCSNSYSSLPTSLTEPIRPIHTRKTSAVFTNKTLEFVKHRLRECMSFPIILFAGRKNIDIPPPKKKRKPFRTKNGSNHQPPPLL